MRLIDADALAKAFREAAETDDSKDNRTYWSEALISAAEEADDAPTVDAVEVVRCKDCKWFGDLGCAIRIVDDSDKPTENDYCSFAERRSE